MPATYEEMLAFVLAQLDAPIEQHIDDGGASVMTSGDPREVIVRLTDSHLTVAAFNIAGDASGSAVVPIETGALTWNIVSAESAMRAVRALISVAREARRSTYVECAICGRAMPPEWMDADGVCRECTHAV